MSFDLNDIIPSVDCLVKLERNKDNFQVIITDLDNKPLQNLETYNLSEGDVLTISGLGFKVMFDGINWTPPMQPTQNNTVEGPAIHLKRKMDVE